MSETQKVLWMLTEPIDFKKKDMWDEAERTGQELIKTIGALEYDHEVMNPRALLLELSEKIKNEKFSTVINLASYEYSDFFKEMYPDTPVFHFPISRVRDTVNIVTIGYQIRVDHKSLYTLRNQIDLTRPLIFDDVGHSGGTQIMAMELLDLEAKQAAHAFMLANTGVAYGDKGIVSLLEGMGAEVYYARGFNNPVERVWHVEDIHGGKRRPWTEQVNPLLKDQERFKQYTNGQMQQAEPLLEKLQSLSQVK